jgi:hypothetical protein
MGQEVIGPMIDRISSAQGAVGMSGYAPARIDAAAHLPAALWTGKALTRVARRPKAAALMSVPRIGSRDHSR